MPGSDAATQFEPVRLVLASASPARLATLRQAGIDPVVEVSGVEESVADGLAPDDMAAALADLKCEAVVRRLGPSQGGSRTLVVGCDSVLDVDGVGFGKPETPHVAAERLRRLSGRSAVLSTGHTIADLASGRRVSATARTRVDFAVLREDEIAAYVASGEPLQVAGAFTIDGLGGAFVRGVGGDPWNVVGLSLPLLRQLVTDLGIAWYALWNRG